MGMEQAPAEAGGQRAAAREFELLVSSVSDYAIFLLSTEGHVRTWNLGAERIKGYTPAEIIGQHFRAFYSQEERDRRRPEQELVTAARDGRYEEEGWRIRKDGSRFWANVVITAIRDEDGALIGFGKVTRDLTARRLGEEQLRVTLSELRQANDELSQFGRLVASVRDYAIFMLDAGGYVTTWNAGAEHIKGYSADEIIGRHFSTFYTREDRLIGHPAEELVIAAREGRFEEEGWRVRKDGSRIWASVVITAVRNERGVLVGFAKVTRDLSVRRAADEELRRAQERLERSNAELESFAAVAAHDLREPLGTVGSFAELLLEREADRLSDPGRRMLTQMAGSVARMQDLVDGLLRYATLDDEPEPERVDLAASLDRVLGDLHAQVAARGALVELDLPPDAAVYADASSVDVLLQNLLSNALKFGAPDRPHIVVAARPAPGGWRVAVTDDGAGIEREDQSRIFRAFERLTRSGHVPGSGLGLAICSRVVARAGGELGVDSAPGHGSTFWFVLPAPA
jgi:PAS domain S-box-containing protein